jgi:hypothetical protein
MNCLMSRQHWSLIVTCHNGTLRGSPTDLVVNAMPSKQPPTSSALLKFARGSKGTTAPKYRGRNTQYGWTRVIVSDFWFCLDDIERCVKGSKRSWVLDWPQVPDVWHVLSSTNLTLEETLLLQNAGFKLQKRPSMSPRCMFALSNLFEAPVFDHLGSPNPEVHLSTRNSKSIRRNANAPTAEHLNK